MADASSTAGTVGARRARLRRRARRRARRIAHRVARSAHRAVRRTALWPARLTVRSARRSGEPAPDGRLRIRILLQYAQGGGGTIRTVLNLSGYLARDHDVEIISVFRRRDETFFSLDPRVPVRYVQDLRTPPRLLGRLLSKLPSVLVPIDDASFRSMSVWTELLLLRVLRERRPDVLIGTRPSLNLLAAEVAPPGVVTIGQDHMNLGAYKPGLRREIAGSYRRLTAVSVLTRRSLDDYREELAGSPVRIAYIPNALPDLPGGPSPREGRVILAAGRLTRQKGFDLLLEAYGPIAAAHPDWTLRIFGSGPRRDRLRRLIARHGLEDRVELRARTPDLPGEMTRASVYVLSSRFEGMPMVIIEAMSKGLPVVAFDCPTGPGEMIDHGRDGLLVPSGDVPGLTAALSTLIEDRGMRDRLGERAIVASRAYDLDRVGPLWLRLLDELSPGARHPSPDAASRPDAGPPRRLPARRVVVAAFAFLGLALGALGFFGLDV